MNSIPLSVFIITDAEGIEYEFITFDLVESSRSNELEEKASNREFIERDFRYLFG